MINDKIQVNSTLIMFFVTTIINNSSERFLLSIEPPSICLSTFQIFTSYPDIVPFTIKLDTKYPQVQENQKT